MFICRQSGFSLIEMLAVIGIFMVLATVAVISWDAYAPVMALDSATQALSSGIQLAMEKAIAERNQWFVLLNYSPRYYNATDGSRYQFSRDTYVLVDDDGWLGLGTTAGERSRMYNEMTMSTGSTPFFAPLYVPDSTNYTTHFRGNNLIERNEIYKGPLRLGRGIQLIPSVDDGTQVKRIVFDYEDPKMFWQSQLSLDNQPIALADRRTDAAKIYLCNSKYRPGDTSRDNLTHLRIIKVFPQTVKIIK